MRIAFIYTLIIISVSGCCVLPDDITISINDDFERVNHILKCVDAKQSGEGLVDEIYFDDLEENGDAIWFLLPDNTMLGLNLLKNKKLNKLQIKQILVGEQKSGYTDRISWDMQVKTLFQKLDVANYLNKDAEADVIQFIVGEDFMKSVSIAFKHNCTISKNHYEYDEQENIKYLWIELPDKTVVQICGYYEKGSASKILTLVEILVCNSQALFDYRIESWYSTQSLRMSNLGKKLWGVDVQSSYFNIYKGMYLTDALKTLKLSKCNLIEDPIKIDTKKLKILSCSSNLDEFNLEEYQQYQLNDESILLLKSSQPTEYANKKISNIFLYTKAPDLDAMTTTHYLIEYEFIDLVNPIMHDWYEQVH